MGINNGLLARACGMPVNQTGCKPSVNMGWLLGGETGITVGFSSRSGKYEMSEELGGGRIRANSAANADNGLCI